MPFAVSCSRCGSRFALTDELYDRKVKGRLVTVRCKNCKSDITIDGVELASRPSQAPPEPVLEGTPTVPLVRPKQDEPITSGPVSRSASAHPPSPGLWVVSYADTDDRELTVLQIERALARREINEHTLVWRDGMDEWLPLSKVAELAELAARVRSAKTGGLFGTGMSVPPPKPPSKPPPKPEATPALPRVETKPKESPKPPTVAPKPALPKAPAPKKREITAEAPESEDEAPPESSGTPALSMLTTGLKKEGGDHDAEDAILTLGSDSGPVLGPPTIDLSNLTAPLPEVEEIEAESIPPSAIEPLPESKPKPKASPKPKPKPEPKPARPAATERARRSEPPPREAPRSIVPWLVLAAAAAVAVWWFVFRPRPVADPPPPVATLEPPPVDPPPAPVETSAPTAVTDPMHPPETPTSTAPTAAPLPPGTAPTVATPPEKPAETPPEPKPDPAKPKPPEKEVALAGPFDKGAASAALNAAAGRASSCRKEGDPSGMATVVVTFAPSGRVTNALVNGRPFAGTATGGCIAATLRSASIPPFSGDKVTVSKTVVIN